MPLSQADLHHFVSNLDVHAHDVSAPPHAARSVAQAAFSASAVPSGTKASVAASAVQVFGPEVTQQMQQDVLSSTLLAQLAAQKAAGGGPEQNPQVWYGKYREVLANVGWTITDFQMGSLDVTQYNNTSEVILELAKKYLDPEQYSLIEKTLSVITQPNNSRPYGIFNNSAISASNKSAGFNFGAVSAYDGNPSFRIFANWFTAQANIREDGFLWFKFSSSSGGVDFNAGNQSMTLNSKFYAENAREVVIKKLGKHLQNYVSDLDI
jgi:hypothetical protein